MDETDSSSSSTPVKGKAKNACRNTAACEACQERKRKCDGTAPCSFCVVKKRKCVFSQQKKRGPSKKRVRDDEVPEEDPSTQVRELELYEQAEAHNFLQAYHHCNANGVFPSSGMQKLLNADTTPLQVQLYATLADAAQVCGDYQKARTYINQARVLAGSIYDSFDADSIRGLMLMRNYWYHTLDFTMCSHYAGIAGNMAKFAKTKMDFKLQNNAQFAAVMSDFTIPNRKKQKAALKLLARTKNVLSIDYKIFYLEISAYFLEHFNWNIYFPPTDTASNIFLDLSDVSLDEKTWRTMLDCVNAEQLEATTVYFAKNTKALALQLTTKVIFPLFKLIINWRGGHTAEAIENAHTCVEAFDAFRALNTVMHPNILSCTLGYAQICMFGFLIQFCTSHGLVEQAERVAYHLSDLCKTRGPDYDAVENNIKEYWKSGFVLPAAEPKLSPPTPLLTSKNKRKKRGASKSPQSASEGSASSYSSSSRESSPSPPPLDVSDPLFPFAVDASKPLAAQVLQQQFTNMSANNTNITNTSYTMNTNNIYPTYPSNMFTYYNNSNTTNTPQNMFAMQNTQFGYQTFQNPGVSLSYPTMVQQYNSTTLPLNTPFMNVPYSMPTFNMQATSNITTSNNLTNNNLTSNLYGNFMTPLTPGAPTPLSPATPMQANLGGSVVDPSQMLSFMSPYHEPQQQPQQQLKDPKQTKDLHTSDLATK